MDQESFKMPLGTEVCLGPGHIVLDGDPAPPSQERGTAAPPPLIKNLSRKTASPKKVTM